MGWGGLVLSFRRGSHAILLLGKVNWLRGALLLYCLIPIAISWSGLMYLWLKPGVSVVLWLSRSRVVKGKYLNRMG